MDNIKMNHRNSLLDAIALAIEKTGHDDESYDDVQKARDILDVLESLLAYAIYNTSVNPDSIRDSCEESYVNIRRQALMLFNRDMESTLN